MNLIIFFLLNFYFDVGNLIGDFIIIKNFKHIV